MSVRLDVDERGIARLDLDRPDRGNSMSRELLTAFSDAIAKVRADARVRVLVIRGRGKHFCTGADLADSPTMASKGPVELRRALRAIYDPFLSVLDVEVPTLASIHGAAIGGGFGLALACDMRIVADDAKLQANFARIGIHPGMAITYLLPRLVGFERAASMLYTGLPVAGRDAPAMGLALRSVPADALEAETNALAQSIADGAPEVIRLTKRTLRPDVGAVRRAADEEAIAQAFCAGLDDAREGILAFAEKRAPRFKGC